MAELMALWSQVPLPLKYFIAAMLVILILLTLQAWNSARKVR